MALTNAQYNAHARQLIVSAYDAVAADRREARRNAFLWLVRGCIFYSRQGVDQKEAALRLMNEVAVALFGRTPTAAELHEIRNHWAAEVEPGTEGEL